MRNNKVIKILVILILFAIIISQPVYADVGPKPSVTIYVKNFKNKSYYLDLLTKGDRLKYSDTHTINSGYRVSNCYIF